MVTLPFANGSVRTVTYAADGSRRLAKERLEVFSRERTAVLDDHKEPGAPHPEPPRGHRSRTQDKGHSREMEVFLEGIMHGRQPVPLNELANMSIATLAIFESLRTGRPVRIAPRA